MKNYILIHLFFFFAISLQSQNVGIGTTNPQALLHLKDGGLHFEANNKYFDFRISSSSQTGFRFYDNSIFKGAWFYNGQLQKLNLSSNGNVQGMVYRLNDNKLLLGRDFVIGAESFGVRSQTSNFGGMYLETTGETGKPFYGYATDSIARMWHYYDGNTGSWRIHNAGERLSVTNTGNVGISTVVPEERLHVVGNIRMDGGSPSFQFYQQGVSKAELRHTSNSFYLNNKMNGSMFLQTNNSTKMAIQNDGDVGIGTISPIAKLHVNGNQGDLISGDGILSLGSSANRMSFGVEVSGEQAGTGRIYAKGNNKKLILGAGTEDVLFIDGSEKRIGIGVLNPNYTFDVVSDGLRGVNVKNEFAGASTKYGARFEATVDGSGQKYGVYGLALGNNTHANNIYGGRFLANPNGSSGNVYGIYSQVSSLGSGNRYGIYTFATTTDPGPNKKSWALYSVGNSYFSNEVRIGNINGAQGYKLAVDGKILSEELKVQMSGDWPDYVFEEEYNLRSTYDIEKYILENGHLPGVPSAAEVKEEGGVHLGEMNRILLEKVEELTLLLIAQNKRINQLEEKVNK